MIARSPRVSASSFTPSVTPPLERVGQITGAGRTHCPGETFDSVVGDRKPASIFVEPNGRVCALLRSPAAREP